MSLDETSLKVERVKKRLFDSVSEPVEIERETDQHTSILWYKVRQPRITASQTGMSIKGKYKTNKGNYRGSHVQAKYSNEAHEGRRALIWSPKS